MCDDEIEDVDHVLNVCPHVERTLEKITDEEVHGEDIKCLKEVAKRMKNFFAKVEQAG